MASNDEEIRVAITAQADQYNAAMAQVSADTEAMGSRVAEEAAAFNSAQQAKFDALMRLSTAFRANLTTNEALSEAEGALDQAMAAGAVSAQEYAAYVAQLDAAETAMTASTAAATEAVNANTAALTLNGGVAREVGVLIGELARGNYTRLEGSTITLANRTGVLASALGFLMSPLGMLTIAAAAAGYAIFETGEDFDKMEGAVLATGEAAGYTAGQLMGMANQIGEAHGNIGEAEDALRRLALSGRFAGDDLRLVATAAVSMSQLTGQSIQATVSELEKLQEDPLRAAAKLNDQLHFLTVTEYQQMEQLAKAGDVMGAARVAYEALANTMVSRSDEAAEHVNVLVKAWRDLKSWGSNLAQETDHMLGGGDSANALNEAKEMMTYLQEQKKTAEAMGSSALPGIELRLKRQQEIVDQLTQQFQSQADAAAKVGQAAQKSAAQIDQMAGKGGKHGGAGDLEAELRKEEDLQRITYDKREDFEREYWQKVYASAQQGSAQQIEAWQHLQQMQRQLDEQQLSEWKESQRKKTEAAREASRQIIATFETEREQAGAASLQRIQIDAQMQDRIAGLYGQNSEQYRRALQERLSDTKAYVSAVEQAEKKRESDLEQIYKKDAESAINAANEGFSHLESIAAQKLALGQLTVEQQLALDRDYASREYQIDREILERWAQTFQGRKNVVDTVNAQIETLERKHQQQMDAIDQKAAQKRMQDAEKYLQPITRAFNQSIAGMIQGTQTFKQGWDRMLQSILLSFVQTELQVVEKHLASEMAQTSATAAGTQSRITIQAAGAAESKSIDATTGKSQIGTAAATGAAKAYQAMVGIPYVGPIIAPIAAAVAFAGIEAFGGSISSAAGGWDRVPVDDAPALLHRNEMVLPANLADRVRGMTDQGGGGGGDTHHHYHINAMDSRSFRDWARRNPHEVASAAQNARRKGY